MPCASYTVFLTDPCSFFLLATVHWLGLQNTEQQQQQNEMPPALAFDLVTGILPEMSILAQT